MEIEGNEYTTFVITGLTYMKERFKITHSANQAGWYMANKISMLKGSIWGITPEGKRKLLKRK